MTSRHLSLFIAGVCLPMWVLAGGARAPMAGTGGAEGDPHDLRKSLEALRLPQREEFQRDDAWAGRRLTPPELAQLREQVRQQLPSRMAVMTPAELRPAESSASTSAPVSTTPGTVWPVRSQRP